MRGLRNHGRNFGCVCVCVSRGGSPAVLEFGRLWDQDWERIVVRVVLADFRL